MQKYIISKFQKEFIFWKNKIIRFVNVETDPRLQHTYFGSYPKTQELLICLCFVVRRCMLDSTSVVSKVGEVCVTVTWLSMVSADVLFFSVLVKLCLWTFKTLHTPNVTYYFTMNDAITDIFYCCYWEHPWGTHWEPDGNSLGTWRNKGKMKKIPPSPPTNIKEK